MKVLGVCASSRKWGNTEILVRQALNGARRCGAETRFVRLCDYRLDPCAGCMACVLSDVDCRLKDDLHPFLEEMRWAEAFVFGSPTYILGSTGLVKTLGERLLRFETVNREFAGKMALVIATAGREGWEPFALPQLATLPLSLGIKVVDQFIGYGQGPAEVLFDQIAMARATESGKALGCGESIYRGEAGTCPCCHFDLVRVAPSGDGVCLLCQVGGRWSDDGVGLRFVPHADSKPRWDEETVASHFAEQLLPSGRRFRERKSELQERLASFKESILL